jgi:hypothetical protein
MKIDITSSSFELAKLIQQDPKLIERDLLNHGSEILALFEDSNFSDSFQNFRQLKQELFKMALEDLAMGAITLKTSTIGLSFKDNKIKTFITPFGSMPQGNVMFSISLKNVVAFKRWRDGLETEMPQDELNAALYRVIVALSKVIQNDR